MEICSKAYPLGGQEVLKLLKKALLNQDKSQEQLLLLLQALTLRLSNYKHCILTDIMG